jgi:hypothetical protein
VLAGIWNRPRPLIGRVSNDDQWECPWGNLNRTTRTACVRLRHASRRLHFALAAEPGLPGRGDIPCALNGFLVKLVGDEAVVVCSGDELQRCSGGQFAYCVG